MPPSPAPAGWGLGGGGPIPVGAIPNLVPRDPTPIHEAFQFLVDPAASWPRSSPNSMVLLDPSWQLTLFFDRLVRYPTYNWRFAPGPLAASDVVTLLPSAPATP